MPTMVITEHAVDRFIERVVPGLSLEDARVLLATLGSSAVRLRERSLNGQVCWKTSDPEALLVTKFDPRVGIVCVTVLEPDEPVAALDPMESAEVLAAYERATAPAPEAGRQPLAYVAPAAPLVPTTLSAKLSAKAQKKQQAKARRAQNEADKNAKGKRQFDHAVAEALTKQRKEIILELLDEDPSPLADSRRLRRATEIECLRLHVVKEQEKTKRHQANQDLRVRELGALRVFTREALRVVMRYADPATVEVLLARAESEHGLTLNEEDR